ncbi:PAS domain S-box protein [Chloroflexota bacterium]
MKRLTPYLMLSLIILLGYTFVLIQLDGQNVKKLEASFNEQQAIHVNLAARAIEDRYNWQLTILDSLANLLILADDIDANWQEVIALFSAQSDSYHEYPFIGLIDTDGQIQQIASFAPEHELVAIELVQQNIPHALESQSVYVSPVYATPEDQTYSIFFPLIQENTLIGYLVLVVDFYPTLERHIIPIRSGQYGAAWIQDHDGIVIYDHETEIIGQSVYDLHANYPLILNYDYQFLVDPSGTGEYTFTVQRNGDVRRKLLAWNTAQLGNQSLTVAMSAPDSEISTLVFDTRQLGLWGGIILLVFLTLGGIIVSSSQQQQLQTLVDERTAELRKERQLLEEQEKMLRLSLDAARAGVWVWDVTSQKVVWDETMAAIYGTLLQEFEGTYEAWRAFVHPEDITAVETALNAALAGQTQFDDEFRIIFPDGIVHYMLGQSLVLHDEQDRPVQMVGINIDITDRKQAEEALRESKALYQSLVDSLPISIYRIDLDGRLTFINRSRLNDMGFSEDEVLGKTAHDLYPADLAKKYSEDDAKVIQTNTIFRTTEKNVDLQTNTIRHVEVIKIPIHNEDGNSVGIQGVFWDVTERIEAAQRLENYSRQLEILHEIASILGSTLNLDEVLQACLKELEKLIPYSSASIFLDEGKITRYVAGRYLPDYDNPVALSEGVSNSPFYHQIKQSRKPIRLEDVRQNPDWIVFDENLNIRSWMGIPLTFKGKFLGLLGLDHTEVGVFDDEQMTIASSVAHQAASAIENAQLYADLEKRIEQRTLKLRESEAKERALLEAIPDAVFRLHRDGTILDSRIQTHEDFFGESNTIVGNLLQDAFPPETATLMLAKLEVTLQSQVMQTYTYPQILSDGTSSYFEARIVAISDNEAVVLIRDISQEHELEEQRERFIANAAHELKTPLTILITRIYLMRKAPKKMDTHLDILDEVSQNMKTLIDGLLDISRFESGMLQLNKKSCQLDEIVTSVVSQLLTNAEEKKLHLILESPDNMPPMYLDSLRISQAIINLVVNAINYTNEGQVKVTLDYQEEYATITVQDTGNGIPAEYLPDEIFLPFNRAHRQSTTKGTGLGLAISKEIIEFHNGTISVTSKLDEGTIFTIRLPVLSKN